MLEKTTVKENKAKSMEKPELEITKFENIDVITMSCLAKGTKISMQDGSLKNIEDIKLGDKVLTFDHEDGTYKGNEVHYIYKSSDPKCAFTLNFEDKNSISVIGEHDFFCKEDMKYAFVSENNCESFVGKHFYNAVKGKFVELVSVKFETEKVDFFEIYSSKALNTVANEMLNVADDVDYMLNIYEFDENIKADKKALEEDIKKFGLRKNYDGMSDKEFDDWNDKYIDVVIGKGLKTAEELKEINSKYKNDRQ